MILTDKDLYLLIVERQEEMSSLGSPKLEWISCSGRAPFIPLQRPIARRFGSFLEPAYFGSNLEPARNHFLLIFMLHRDRPPRFSCAALEWSRILALRWSRGFWLDSRAVSFYFFVTKSSWGPRLCARARYSCIHTTNDQVHSPQPKLHTSLHFWVRIWVQHPILPPFFPFFMWSIPLYNDSMNTVLRNTVDEGK